MDVNITGTTAKETSGEEHKFLIRGRRNPALPFTHQTKVPVSFYLPSQRCYKQSKETLCTHYNVPRHISTDPWTPNYKSLQMRQSSQTRKKHIGGLGCHAVTATCHNSWREESHGEGQNRPLATNTSSPVQFSLLHPVSSTACRSPLTVTSYYYQSEQNDRQRRNKTTYEEKEKRNR